MTYRLSPRAIDDLEEIEIYTTQKFGTAVAARTEERLVSAFQLLTEFPDLGRTRPDITPISSLSFS